MNELPSAWVLPGIYNLTPKKSNYSKFYIYVLKCIADSHGVKVNYIISKIGTEDRVYLRQMFWYFMRETYGIKATYVWLGNLFNCDHTTVMYGVKKFKDGLDIKSKIPKKVISTHRTFNDDYFFTKQKIEQWV